MQDSLQAGCALSVTEPAVSKYWMDAYLLIVIVIIIIIIIKSIYIAQSC